MDELALVREQAARLQAAFETGYVWTRRGPRDPCPVEQHEPVVPALLPDYVFAIQEFRGRPCVVVEFGLEGDPPGLRWLHRFEPVSSPAPEQDESLMSFQEGIDSGWLGRSLARVGAGTSPVWTDFSWGHPRGRSSEAMGLFDDGHLDQAVSVLRDEYASTEDLELADQIARLAACTDAAAGEQMRKRIWQTFRERNRRKRDNDRAATAASMRRHRLLDGF